jgi:hypothetical protein
VLVGAGYKEAFGLPCRRTTPPEPKKLARPLKPNLGDEMCKRLSGTLKDGTVSQRKWRHGCATSQWNLRWQNGVGLHMPRPSPGELLPMNTTPVPVPDCMPPNLESKVWDAAGKLSNRRSEGALMKRAKHIKEWLQGIWMEKDSKQCKGN